MHLTALLERIESSDPTDWHPITCWGYGSGPSFRYDLNSHVRDADDTAFASHGQVASYIKDLSCTIAWGMSDGRPPKVVEWSPDGEVTHTFADVFWCGALVHRTPLVVVDGGRCYLPSPSAITSDGEVVRRVVTAYSVALARLVHTLTHGDGYSFGQYLGTAGLTVV